MAYSKDEIAEINAEQARRQFIAETKGGIPLIDVLAGLKTVPENYTFDPYSHCYIPPDVDIGIEAAKLRAN